MLCYDNFFQHVLDSHFGSSALPAIGGGPGGDHCLLRWHLRFAPMQGLEFEVGGDKPPWMVACIQQLKDFMPPQLLRQTRTNELLPLFDVPSQAGGDKSVDMSDCIANEAWITAFILTFGDESTPEVKDVSRVVYELDRDYNGMLVPIKNDTDKLDRIIGEVGKFRSIFYWFRKLLNRGEVSRDPHLQRMKTMAAQGRKMKELSDSVLAMAAGGKRHSGSTVLASLGSASAGPPTGAVAPLADATPTGAVAPLADASLTGAVAPLADASPTAAVVPFADPSPTGAVALTGATPKITPEVAQAMILFLEPFAKRAKTSDRGLAAPAFAASVVLACSEVPPAVVSPGNQREVADGIREPKKHIKEIYIKEFSRKLNSKISNFQNSFMYIPFPNKNAYRGN